MLKPFLDFLVRVYTNKNKDMFTVRLGVSVLLGKLGIVGTVASLIAPTLCGVIGVFMESGVFLIDVTLDTLREGMTLKNFERDAKKAYEHATKKVYDEAEKQKIRKQYLEIISRIGTVGNGPK